MAWSPAQGLARPNARQKERKATARRARGVAVLVALAVLSLVTLLVTAFGTEGQTPTRTLGPAPAQRLLPSGPPRPRVVAMRENLRILLPIAHSRVTAIGYHAAGTGTLALDPVGTQANPGLFERLLQRVTGRKDSGMSYYLLDGGAGPETSGLDVGAPLDTDVYAPVDGTVLAISDYIVNGARHGVRIDIQPSGNPGVVVSIDHLRPDPALTVGSTVSAARTKIGRVIDLSRVERAALGRYTQNKGHHVHIDVRPASALAR